MDKNGIKTALRQHFSVFQQGELVEEIASKGIYMYVPSDQYILEVGSFIKVIPLVIKGSVKVVRQEKSGEIFLYYIRPGQSCAMTLSSCMKREKSRIKAIVQEDTELVALPAEDVYYMIRKYPAWQNFVVETYSQRFDEIMEVLDHVVFHKLDERLFKYLQKRSSSQNSLELPISHQEIASDLATSREVISRLLKQLERQGLIQLFRGKIVLHQKFV